MKLSTPAAVIETDGTSTAPRVAVVFAVRVDSFQALVTRTTSNDPSAVTPLTYKRRLALAISDPAVPAGRVARSSLMKEVDAALT
jgi:hypothetical protein